jgi:hypothetical protein
VAAVYVTWQLNWMDWHALAGGELLVLLLFPLSPRVSPAAKPARSAQFLASSRAAAAALLATFL